MGVSGSRGGNVSRDPGPTDEPCPSCRAPVLTGITARPGIAVTLDPRPLDPPAELDAITAGRWTYTLHGDGTLTPRSGRQITHRPAGTRARETVLREHRCQGGT